MQTPFSNSSTLGVVVVLLLVGMRCTSNNDPTPADCTSLALEVPAANLTMPTGCTLTDGSLLAVAAGGRPPYKFSLDDGATFQDQPLFSNLAAGVYDVVVRDANNCEATRAEVTLEQFVSNLSVTVPEANTVDPTNCTVPNGSITAVPANGTGPYQFSLNGGAFQADATFDNLGGGTYTITVKDGKGCESSVSGITLVNAASDIAVTVPVANISHPTGCTTNDGEIVAIGSGGVEPYTYALGSGTFQSSSTFANLAPGTYAVTIKDALGCTNTASNLVVREFESTLAISNIDVITSGCGTALGSISMSAVGGQTPFEYALNGTNFGVGSQFNNLSAGTYSVTVRDATGCIATESDVKVTTGISYNSHIKPILQTNCIKSGCHDGGTAGLSNWSVFSTVQASADAIKRETQSGSMPENGTLTQEEKNQIACWVDDGALNN